MNYTNMKYIRTDKGSFSKVIPGALILIVVVMRFKAPINEETPAM